MKPPLSAASRLAAWLQSCGLLFILSGLLLAWSAAAINAAGKLRSEPAPGTILAGFALYGLLAIAGLFVLNILFRRLGSTRFLWLVLGLSLLIQLVVIGLADSRWQWTGDASIFRHYLDVLSEHGYAEQTLGDLSRHYDYRVWPRRALPFYYALRTLAGDRFVPAVQLFQALLLTLSLALTWRVARLLFGLRTAFWSVSLQLLMPFRWFLGLDLNHHILGGFYFLAGLWLLAEWFRTLRPAGTRWACAVGMAILLPLMRLEGGIDFVWIGAMALTVLLAWLTGRQAGRETGRAVIALLLLPLLAASLTVSPLVRRMDAADRHRHESGPIGFMARGWAPETGGEYCGTYEILDYLTPHEDKTAVQASILASQTYYNPRVLLTSLLPVKMAKYFLLGYASGAEEMLARNGAHQAQRLAEGARTAFLLGTLPLMLWGGILLLPRLRRPRRLELLLPGAMLCATYVLLGETSPRYSIYIQPFLFMLAAQPLALSARPRRILIRTAPRPVAWAALSLAAVLCLAGALLWIARPVFGRAAFQDMRHWSTEAPPGLDVPATLAPFEIHLTPQLQNGDTSWGPFRLPSPDPPPRFISFYAFIPGILPSGRRPNVTLQIETPDGIRTNSLPARIRMPYPPNADGNIRFRVPANLPHPLRIGYATYEFD